MRVLMITGYIPFGGGGGVERHVYELSAGLIKRGVDVRIACENKRYLPAGSEGLEDRLILSDVRRLPWEPLKQLGKSITLSRSFDPSEFDVIHGHSLYGTAAILKGRFRRGRKPVYVTTLHGTTAGVFSALCRDGLGLPIPMPGTAAIMALELASAKASEACIAVSRSTAREARAYYHVPDTRIHTIYNWVDKSRFKPMDRGEARKRLGLEPGKRYLLFTGRTDRVKGFPMLLQAMKAIGDMAVLLVASKDMSESPMDNVKCLGYVDDGLLPIYYAACDLLAFPSIYEGLPLTLLESISCGAVPVCMNRPPMGEVIDDSMGYMCDSFDPGEYARMVLAALKDNGLPDRPRRCIEGSKKFDMDKSIDATLALYESLLKR
jgi:teichuronic acid biosynthesis glycosyltransferase TuaC